MMTRHLERLASAQYLNSLTRDELFRRAQITRIAKLDGLDCLDVPVYSSVRPEARVISVSAGKSRSREMARAGAVAEGIEFWLFEHPVGEFRVGPLHRVLPFPTCKDSLWTSETPIAIERVTRYSTGLDVPFPSDLIWLVSRAGDTAHFMRTSNGQALGSTFEDAFLQGLLESIERDQLTLRRISLSRLGVFPPVMDLESDIPESIRELHEKCRAASLKLYLFYCTYDIPIPTYWAMLIDDPGVCATLSGWGAHVTHELAAERAILEAIQGRSVYIAGARDDIERRKFQAVSDHNRQSVIDLVESQPKIKWTVGPEALLATSHELDLTLAALGPWRDKIYFKHIDLGDMHAVKSVVLGLEQPMMGPLWRSMRWETLYANHLCRAQSLQSAA